MKSFLAACLGLLLGVAPAAAERLISVGGAITEIVYLLGADGALVAVDTTSGFPPAVGKLPQVGYMRALSAEGLMSLRPDLIVAADEAGPAAVLQQISAAGVAVKRIPEPYDPAGVALKIREVAKVLGKDAVGELLAQDVTNRLAQVTEAVAKSSSKPRVLFLLSAGRGAPMAGGQGTAADAMIRLAGGTNVVTYPGYKPLGVETMLGEDPDLLLLTSQTVDALGGIDAVAKLPGVAGTRAAASGKIVAFEAVYLLGFGPRLPEALMDLARSIHPELKP